MRAIATEKLLEQDACWLNLTQAARLLALAPSTLSRRAAEGQVNSVPRGLGRGELLVSPAEVLRLAGLYRRVPVDEVLDRLARIVAGRLRVSEQTVKLRLREAAPVLSIEDAVRLRMAKGKQATRGGTMSVNARPGARDVAVEEMPIPPMPEDSMPSPTLLQALDMCGAFEWEGDSEIDRRRVRVVEGGDLEPDSGS